MSFSEFPVMVIPVVNHSTQGGPARLTCTSAVVAQEVTLRLPDFEWTSYLTWNALIFISGQCPWVPLPVQGFWQACLYLWRCHYFGSLLSTHRLSLFLWLILFEVFWNQKVSLTVIFWYVSLSWGRALELPNLMNGHRLQLWDSFDLMVYGFHFHLSQCVITYPISKQHFRWKILNLKAGWGCSTVVPQELWEKGFI